MKAQVIRGGTLVTPAGIVRADLRVEDELITEIGPELSAGSASEIDATGLQVMAAVIDAHVHFNEPGRAEWEGAQTGSRALAAGGGAVFFDMPLNSTPCTVNARAFDLKRAALESASIADFALWAGLVPGNRGEMSELAARGVVGFKAFLCDSGLPEFPRSDDLTLWEGLREAARLDLPVAVHAENHEIIGGLTAKSNAAGGTSIRDFLASRPVIAEVEAIERAALMAREAGAKLHIVHISSGRGVVAAAEARARGADVSIETCPHYLFFTEGDLEQLGAIAKCAPPLRDETTQIALWAELMNGSIDIVASDHSPAPPDMKNVPFHRAWGGISGVQSTLSVLLDRGYAESRLPLERIAELVAANPAARFRIGQKGAIKPGNHADLVFVDLANSRRLDREHLADRHRLSPYAGYSFRGVVRRTMRRGETIYLDGAFPAQTCGRFVRPAK